MAKALVGHFVAPDPVAAAEVRALRQRVAQLEARVLLLEAELAAHPAVVAAAPVEDVAVEAALV